jgi:hypothetical protein
MRFLWLGKGSFLSYFLFYLSVIAFVTVHSKGFIDWCLTSTLVVFQLYCGVNKFTIVKNDDK